MDGSLVSLCEEVISAWADAWSLAKHDNLEVVVLPV